MGFYFIRDNRDTGLANNPITLPSGDQEAELLLADRQFDINGQLYFPRLGQSRQPERPAVQPRQAPVLDPGVLR